jgi:hypothetical protein
VTRVDGAIAVHRRHVAAVSPKPPITSVGDTRATWGTPSSGFGVRWVSRFGDLPATLEEFPGALAVVLRRFGRTEEAGLVEVDDPHAAGAADDVIADIGVVEAGVNSC